MRVADLVSRNLVFRVTVKNVRGVAYMNLVSRRPLPGKAWLGIHRQGQKPLTGRGGMRDPGRRDKTGLEAAEVGRFEDGRNGVAIVVNSNRYVVLLFEVQENRGPRTGRMDRAKAGHGRTSIVSLHATAKRRRRCGRVRDKVIGRLRADGADDLDKPVSQGARDTAMR